MPYEIKIVTNKDLITETSRKTRSQLKSLLVVGKRYAVSDLYGNNFEDVFRGVDLDSSWICGNYLLFDNNKVWYGNVLHVLESGQTSEPEIIATVGELCCIKKHVPAEKEIKSVPELVESKEIYTTVMAVINENPKALEDHKKGKNVISFLIGRVLAKTRHNAVQTKLHIEKTLQDLNSSSTGTQP